jgi:hypothetical protein
MRSSSSTIEGSRTISLLESTIGDLRADTFLEPRSNAGGIDALLEAGSNTERSRKRPSSPRWNCVSKRTLQDLCPIEISCEPPRNPRFQVLGARERGPTVGRIANVVRPPRT